ncbi:DUF6345 domain-containing protein [Paracoccus lutimaris]|uniref:Uncharacterized protein n=1 Tax=Paracoccus lutimaris TaxID=1490030 RepID=A0A368Z9I1_9RHOB|nr:DUF6345 domain-containing protein [Paracoccus lutimaris]RCW88659.1 hypothetical protein DFP89_10192 [Paracoccus lutimaris]
MDDLVGSFDSFEPGMLGLNWAEHLAGDPAAPVNSGMLDACRPSTQVYGACSVETYRAAGALNAAHRDAGGFLDAVDSFAAPDYWRRDAAVKSWLYDSGLAAAAGRNIDAVRVFYHAGHGRMDDTGNFRLPMGALWTGVDACLESGRMWLGADKLRYLFWSTSESLCVSEGRNPLRSWARSNAGLRMMFGFDSVCWDSGSYGANFWRHWRMGKSFSQAWLDGAWDVAHDQNPVVAACGATRDEALATLFDERRFDAARAKGSWWAWRWHATLPAHRRDVVLSAPPSELRTARLVPVAEDTALAERVLHTLNISPRLVPRDDQGRMTVSSDAIHFMRRADGHILLELARSGPGERERSGVPIQRRALVNRARSALRRYGFVSPGSELVFDRISLALSATQSLHLAAEPPVETLDEIIVQFRQSIGGIPILTPGAGTLRLAMRPDGTVLRIESTLRQVAELLPARSYSNSGSEDPPVPEGFAPTCALEAPGTAQSLARHSARLMRDLAARGAAPLNLTILPGTTEVGYGVRSNTARIVAREGIEIECARGFRKRYWMQSNLGD